MIDKEASVKIAIQMMGGEAASAIETILTRMEKVQKGMDAISTKLTNPQIDYGRDIPRAQMMADDRLLASQDRQTRAIEDLANKLDRLPRGTQTPMEQAPGGTA